MPKYAVEVTYRLPRYKHVIVEADNPADACQKALDSTWDPDDEAVLEIEDDYETSGPEYITGLWAEPEGSEDDPEPYHSPTVDIPPQFEEKGDA
jgi:hypothetical protein